MKDNLKERENKKNKKSDTPKKALVDPKFRKVLT